MVIYCDKELGQDLQDEQNKGSGCIAVLLFLL
jgi:hypothetical protein